MAAKPDKKRLLHVRDSLDIDKRDAGSQSTDFQQRAVPSFFLKADLRGTG
jgi:hypothetical protein